MAEQPPPPRSVPDRSPSPPPERPAPRSVPTPDHPRPDPYPDPRTSLTMVRRGSERGREAWAGRQASSLDDADVVRAHAAGYEPGLDGYLTGRDPRQMRQDELLAMGHAAMSPMAAIRARCLDCCAGSSDEARKCVAMACPSWPFRTGKNPWRAPLSEEQRDVRRQVALRRGFGAPRKGGGLSSDDEDAMPATTLPAEAPRSPGAGLYLDENAGTAGQAPSTRRAS
jgi:hypothetical protein